MSMSTFVNNSRTAPRDPQDTRRKQAKILFHDKKQYKLAEERSDEELPPQKEGVLASSGRGSRQKAMHRSFASPASARANARAQVEEIILTGSDRGDRDVEERETDRIQRLREMNRKRLSALERKLQQLQQQKREMEDSSEDDMRGGTSPARDRGAKQEEASAQEPSPPAQPRTAWAAQSNRPPSAPPGRPKVSARVPPDLPSGRSARTSQSPSFTIPESEAESDDGRDRGYTSDPGQDRHMARDPLSGGRSSIALGRKKPERGRTLQVVPFRFDGRVRPKSRQQQRFDEEMAERREQEALEYDKRVTARNPPKSSLMRDLYQKSVLAQQRRSEENRARSRQRLQEAEAPFSFWREARERGAREMEALERDVEAVKERLVLLADDKQTARARIARVERQAWESVQTDFTSVEEAELDKLARKLRMDGKLRPREEERHRELQRERSAKHGSRAYVTEKHRRLRAELEQQENRFRSTPVPKAVTDDVSAELAEEARVRKLRRDERKNMLREQSQWPTNMVRQGHAEKLEQRQREMERRLRERDEERRQLRASSARAEEGDGERLTAEHTFRPKIRDGVPDFGREHARFRRALVQRRLELQREARHTALRPFHLRSEWLPLSKFSPHRAAYEAAPVSSRLRRKKLAGLGLGDGASQWELVEALAAANHQDPERSGVTQEQVWEYCITPPSQHAISAQISSDIQVLRDSRWPHTRGGRCEAKPKPIAAGRAHKWRETEAYMKRLKFISDEKQRKQDEADAKRRAADDDRKRRREMWGMRERVLNKLTPVVAEQQAKEEEAKKQVINARREFKEKDKEWDDKVMGKVESLKAKSLLMEDITARLKKQAKDQFRKHLKAHGLEDIADEIELPR